MKSKILLFLLASCLLAVAAWFVHVPNPTQADDIPEKYRDTVQKGLEYLVKSQHKDGHWEGDDGKHPVAMTGLVGLALLMEQDNPRGRPRGVEVDRPRVEVTPAKAKYSANIRKAADWLMERSQAARDGLIFSEHPSEAARYMEGHGLATLFLAGDFKNEDDDVRRKKLTDVLTRAVKYIVKAQSTQGGWYHTSKVEGHDFGMISVTVIQIQALQAAGKSGIFVPNGTIEDAQAYLKKEIGMPEAGSKPERNPGRQNDTAGTLACHNIWKLQSSKDAFGPSWFKYCQTEIPVGRDIKFGRDELAHYYYAQALFILGGEYWNGYRSTLFDHLQGTQNKDGSWPTGDGLSFGQVYSTALWCTVLQLDKNSHPSVRQPQKVIE